MVTTSAELETAPKSPEPGNPRISHVAANYVEFVWTGPESESYLYDIEIRQVGATDWTTVETGLNQRTTYYAGGLSGSTDYEARIRTRIINSGFQTSDWVSFPDFSTFEINSFSVLAPEEVKPYNRFVDKWLKNNNRFVDFNQDDRVGVFLTTGSFSFDSQDATLEDIQEDLLVQDSDQIIYGELPFVYEGQEKVITGWWDDYLYVFREGDNRAFFSTNRGGTWTEYTMFTDESVVAQWPEDGRGFVSAGDRAALLGNEYIYTGVNFSGQLRWNSTDINWSSTNQTFSNVESEFNPIGGGGPVISWETQWILPETVSSVSAYDVSREWVLLVDPEGNFWKQSRINPTQNGSGEFEWDSSIRHRPSGDDALIRHVVWFKGWFYFLDLGLRSSGGPVLDSNSGVWRVDPETETFEQVIQGQESARYQPTALSRNENTLVVSLDPVTDTDDSVIDIAVPYRRTRESSDGINWVLRNEKFTYEAWHQWFGNDGWRLFYNWNKELVAIEPTQEFKKILAGTSQTFDVTGTHTFEAPVFSFSGWPGYATGIVFYSVSTEELIAFYEFPWRRRSSITIEFQDNVLLQAQLASITRGTATDVIGGIPVLVNDPKPGITHLLEKVAPETYIHETPRFGEFMRTYLRYISNPDNNGYYSEISNWIDNQDVNKTILLDLFETDLSNRNKTLRGEDRERMIRFLNNRAQDWWGIRGTIDSYRYLFRVLYDEDVEIDIAHKSPVETSFRLLPESGFDPAASLPGKKITSPDRRFYGFVNWVREEIVDDQRVWKVVVQGMIGDLLAGDQIQSHDFNEAPPATDNSESVIGEAWTDIDNEIPDRNQRELLTRGRSVYNLRIKSGINTNRWRKNVIEFVHPVGFNLEGILLLTFLLNAGISTEAEQTYLDRLLTYSWDMGIPLETPERTAVLDSNGEYVRDADGNIETEINPVGGTTIFPPSNYYTDNPETYAGLTTEERRSSVSPLFDETLKRFSNYERI